MRSPCINQQHATEPDPAVRVVNRIDDPYAGLKGHDYIAARKLNVQVKRVQTSAQLAPTKQREAK